MPQQGGHPGLDRHRGCLARWIRTCVVAWERRLTVVALVAESRKNDFIRAITQRHIIKKGEGWMYLPES